MKLHIKMISTRNEMRSGRPHEGRRSLSATYRLRTKNYGP